MTETDCDMPIVLALMLLAFLLIFCLPRRYPARVWLCFGLLGSQLTLYDLGTDAFDTFSRISFALLPYSFSPSVSHTYRMNGSRLRRRITLFSASCLGRTESRVVNEGAYSLRPTEAGPGNACYILPGSQLNGLA